MNSVYQAAAPDGIHSVTKCGQPLFSLMAWIFCSFSSLAINSVLQFNEITSFGVDHSILSGLKNVTAPVQWAFDSWFTYKKGAKTEHWVVSFPNIYRAPTALSM